MSTTARVFTMSLSVLFALLGVAPAATGQWAEFVDETATRLPTPLNDAALSTTDPEEKDFAWGDLDQDGDIDLVVVRKEPFTTTGRRVNVLFMNEGVAEGHAINGVLVDRTAQYASESDVFGDQGFLTPTNDRDVALHDLDNDGWLDIVTATTLTDNQAAHLSHPRVYINKGEVGGVWQGFRYEAFRIPVMHPIAGPRFCSVAAGDVTGDGYADLYFADYDNGVTGDPEQIFDYNNRLLVNLGAANPGVFADQSVSRLTPEMRYSEFGTSSNIADMNDDGFNDIVTDSALVVPYKVAVTYNSPTNEGQFDQGGAYETVFTAAPYFANVGDLNQDGLLDIVITDDSLDRYLLNQGNGGDGLTNWAPYVFPGTEGFGGNSTIADLNGDGFDEVIITDVDVDVPGCGNRTFILHNLADVPNVSFLEHDQVIPDAQLIGVHDAAVFDLDGDGFNDIVLGRCAGSRVWMNVPQFGILFSYPEELPDLIDPQSPHDLTVELSPVGGAVVASATMHVRVNDGALSSVPMSDVGGGLYLATLPAADCGDRLAFFFEADATEGSTFFAPPDAPDSTFQAIAAFGVQVTMQDEIEGDVSGWTITNENLISGAWEQADPNATIFGGALAAPADDATGGDGTMAFVTQNGPPNGFPAEDDVDGGPTRLTSPLIDLSGGDAFIGYHAIQFTAGSETHVPDPLTVEITNNGGFTWVPVPEVTTFGTDGVWQAFSFQVGRFVAPTANVRVRFTSADQPNNSVTESGVDSFIVQQLICDDLPSPCAADVNDDGTVDVQDLTTAILTWGCTSPPGSCDGDVTGDGVVDVIDLVTILLAWGSCDDP